MREQGAWQPPSDTVDVPDLKALSRWLVWQQVGATAVEAIGTVGMSVGTWFEPGFTMNWWVQVEEGSAGVLEWSGLVFVAVASVGSLLLWLAGVPLWTLWHYRAGKQLRAKVPHATSPVAHALWWFVPVAQLVMPYRTTVELLRGTVGRDASLMRWMPSWWAALLGWALLRFAVPSELTLDDLGWLVAVVVLMQALRLWATWVYVRVVREVSEAIG